MGIVEYIARTELRRQAASAIAWWILNYRHADGRVGLSVDELVEIVRLPQLFFKDLLDAAPELSRMDKGVIQANRGIIAEMDVQDFWEILRNDALHEKCHAHALRLAQPDVWPDFVRQMRGARDLLLATAAHGQ